MKKKKMVLRILLATVFAVACISCANTTEATITRVYQPLASGMVHTWIQVQFDDNTEASVILPDNDKIWSKAKEMKGKKVTVKKSNGKWVFVGFKE